MQKHEGKDQIKVSYENIGNSTRETNQKIFLYKEKNEKLQKESRQKD